MAGTSVHFLGLPGETLDGLAGTRAPKLDMEDMEAEAGGRQWAGSPLAEVAVTQEPGWAWPDYKRIVKAEPRA